MEMFGETAKFQFFWAFQDPQIRDEVRLKWDIVEQGCLISEPRVRREPFCLKYFAGCLINPLEFTIIHIYILKDFASILPYWTQTLQFN